MPGLKLFLLGSPYLERAGQRVEMDTRKALALLAYLAVNGGAHSREALAALLWPDYDESGARGGFRRTLSTLNKALGPGVLEISRERIALAPRPDLWVDVWEFQARLADCQAHSHARQEVCRLCLPALQAAAELVRADFLNGFTLRDSVAFDDWQAFQAEALRQELAGVLDRLARGRAANGDFAAGLQAARRWLALDPLNEPAQRLLMQLYEWSGQHAAALRQYRDCVRVLDQQLGVPPLDETTRLYQAVQEQRLAPPLRWDTPPAAPAANPATVAPTTVGPTVVGLTAGGAASGYPLVGRSAELQTLDQAYRSAAPAGFVFALQGEAGVGKTRLAHDWIERARVQGARCLSACCYEGETGLAYGPLIEALRGAFNQPESAGLLRQVDPAWLGEAERLVGERLPPADPQAPGAQSRFLEGICQVLACLCQPTAQGAPGILFLDDLQWADSASLDLLAYLARRLAARFAGGLFLLLAWREEQIPSDHPLRRLLAEARRRGAGAELTLARLPQTAVAELLQAGLARRASSGPLPGDLAGQLYKETEGLPFFIVEYLDSLQGQPSAPQAWPMPQSVRDLLQSRLASVDETGRQLLGAAAVLGRSFEYDMLRQASGRSELEIVGGLERLLQLGLITEQESGEVVYDFSHEKLRRLVYEETSLARRRLLHQRAAEALAARLRQRPESAAAVAQHYQLAGQNAQAADYFRQAGDYARSLFANQAAIAHYQNALACGFTPAAEMHEAIGDLYNLAGQFQAALTSYETAAALCRPERLGWIEHRLGLVHHQRGDWDLAECHFESAAQALDELRAGAEQARVYADWSRTAYRRAHLEQARALAGRALELAEASSNQPALALAHNMLGLLERSQSNYPQAIRHLQHSLEITTHLNDLGGRAAALNNLARLHADRGDLPQALSLTQAALDCSLQQGDRHRAAALHNNLADLFYAAGDSANAMLHLKQAVAVFAEIGQETGGPNPEIWMLAEW